MRLKFAAWTAAFGLQETSNFLRDMAFSVRARELQINISEMRSTRIMAGNEKA